MHQPKYVEELLSEVPPLNLPAIQLDYRGEITATSPEMEVLFPGLTVHGRTLNDTLRDAEKFGFLGAGAASGILNAVSLGHQQHVFDMRDGRTILFIRAVESAKAVNCYFSDVTYVKQVTLSDQRDVLTGLANRIGLIREIDLRLASDTDRAVAVHYLDLDRFKLVNDTLGHPVGDALLKLVSERVSKLLSPGDVFARVGGDEFVILQASGEQPNAVETLAARIIDLVGRTYLINGHSVQVGVSIGIALSGMDGGSSEELIRNADLALFKAKSAGRSTFRFFTESMDIELQARRSMEIDLQRALVLEQFKLAYQPQFQIDGKRLVGFEALLRWSTHERGNVSPADFIPLAEETGMIGPLGEWVLRQACRDAAMWPAPLSVSVNLSPLQFKNPRLVELIVSALGSANLPPSRLDIEITEGALMDDTDATVNILKQIKALGVKVSMDDFGTGYSSLSYLQKFPFDKIKIDQSFIRSLETNPDSAAIVRAVTALGESLGMMTIAEGVETESQLRQITDDGCRQVQGYLTGRPLPFADASILIRKLQDNNA